MKQSAMTVWCCEHLIAKAIKESHKANRPVRIVLHTSRAQRELLECELLEKSELAQRSRLEYRKNEDGTYTLMLDGVDLVVDDEAIMPYSVEI